MPGIFGSLFQEWEFILNKCRIEYDACRYDYELLLSRNHSSDGTVSSTDEHIQRQYEHFKQIYEKSKENLEIKLKLLDENRVGSFQWIRFEKKNIILI